MVLDVEMEKIMKTVVDKRWGICEKPSDKKEVLKNIEHFTQRRI